jgi:hypothetical protein
VTFDEFSPLERKVTIADQPLTSLCNKQDSSLSFAILQFDDLRFALNESLFASELNLIPTGLQMCEVERPTCIWF